MAKGYDCLKCPGYCCSYQLIGLTKRDVERLAKHHHMSFEEARSKFTEEAHGRKYVMRRQKDEHFGKICRFFAQRTSPVVPASSQPVLSRLFMQLIKPAGRYPVPILSHSLLAAPFLEVLKQLAVRRYKLRARNHNYSP